MDRAARRRAGVVSTGVRTRRPEQRRGEILDAALAQFSERGYHNTGVADIATALRMSHGTFYRYFSSKRDILAQMVDELAARITAAATDASAPEGASTVSEYRDQVGRIAGALINVVDDDPRIARLLLLEATGVDPELTARILDLLDGLRQLTADYLRHGVDAGFLRADLDTAQTARAINGMVYAGALHAVRGEGDPDAYAEAAVRLIFDGVG